MKSTDESIATIDGVTVNLFTGTVNFFKAGGSLTFIRHGNEITTLEGVSLPVGIMRNVEFWKSEKGLSAGDIVLLLSDGAVGEDCGWISDELLSWNTADMDDLAGHIARLASLRMTDNTKDDISAVAIKLVYNK
jgi:stage II sporulation protein E